MSASHSTSKTANQTSSVQNTDLTTINKNISGNSGLTAVADTDSTLNLNYAPISINTDSGAIAAGERVANAGIAASTSAAALTSRLAHDVVADAGVTTNLAFGLAGHAVDTISATSRDAQDRTFDFAGSVLTQFGNKLSDYEQASQTQLGNVVSALSDSFVDNSKTADQRVTDATLQAGAQAADTLREVFKYIAIAAVAAGALFLLARGKKVFA